MWATARAQAAADRAEVSQAALAKAAAVATAGAAPARADVAAMAPAAWALAASEAAARAVDGVDGSGCAEGGILSRVCMSYEFQSKSVKPDPVGAPLPP